MNRLVVISVVVISITNGYSQPITSIDIVRIDAHFEKEALYYYEQNWKEFRVAAIKEGHISGFNLLRTAVDSTSSFTVILVTQYPDSAKFRAREDNFRRIIKTTSPDGPKLLNDVTPKSFLKYLYGLDAISIHRSDEKQPQRSKE